MGSRVEQLWLSVQGLRGLVRGLGGLGFPIQSTSLIA